MYDLSQSATAAAPQLCLVARRNNSLTRRARWTVFATLAVISFSLALAWAIAGAWLVLPYSFIEMAVLAAAFAYIERRAGDFERLTVIDDRVIAERSIGRRRERFEWNRKWLTVEVVPARTGGVERIALCGAGMEWEFGVTLPEEERQTVAQALRRVVAAR
jgi:uncharacterized membrane protein